MPRINYRFVSYKDFLFSTVNNQYFMRGDNIGEIEANSVFFILGMTGAPFGVATLAEAGGAIIKTFVYSDFDWDSPIRMDGGFHIYSKLDVTVQYSKVSKGN